MYVKGLHKRGSGEEFVVDACSDFGILKLEVIDQWFGFVKVLGVGLIVWLEL